MGTDSPEPSKEVANSKQVLTKEEKIRLGKAALEEALRAHRVESVRERVAYILNNFPGARDSDKKLAIAYWNCFQNENYNPAIAETIFKLEHVPTLTRERAKIQNDYGLFQAKEKVRRRRIGLELEKHEEYSPGEEPERRIAVYADENGKSDSLMTVGGVWFLDPAKYYDVWAALREYKKAKGIKSEIKFAELTKHNWPTMLSCLDKFLEYKGFTSFKIVYLAAKDLRRSTEIALYDLYRHFLLEGAGFEVDNKRIVLPRTIELMKDKDEGSDVINLKDMQTKLIGDLNIRFNNGLRLVDVAAIPSTENYVIQIVDLIIGSFGRVANRKEGREQNHKDEFAHNALNRIGVDPETLSVIGNNDWIQVTRLGDRVGA